MKLSARLAACLAAFLFIVAMWLGFAYLMRDTALLRDILDVGSGLVILVGVGLFILAVAE